MAETKPKDHYEVLGLDSRVGTPEIEAAAERKFTEIDGAYKTLINPASRAAYDIQQAEYRGSVFKETFREAWADRSRLAMSLATDGYGALSTVGYALGFLPGVGLDILDKATAMGQTGWIIGAYWDDLTAGQKVFFGTISLLEEWLPGPTDLFPSATIAHHLAACNRVRGKAPKKGNAGRL
ncbi:MAG: hypothetical protein HY514_03845 [Candidatus Aenigmarchaeota archaeon]|nr:hypothetical protein [Candidatus Aenigmarchaeota archaeon]